MKPTGSPVATTGVITAAVLLAVDLLGHRVHLSADDVGYVILLSNAAGHTVKPYFAALANKVLPNVHS
jgi:hypothetical protein